MKKYLQSVPKRQESVAPKSSGVCDSCGWDFSKTDHKDKFGRRESRDQINIPFRKAGELVAIVTRCGYCYDRELYARGRGHLSDVMGRVPYATADAVARFALKPQT